MRVLLSLVLLSLSARANVCQRRIAGELFLEGRKLFTNQLSARNPAYLSDYRVGGRVILPVSAMLSAMMTAVAETNTGDLFQLDDVQVHELLNLSSGAKIFRTHINARSGVNVYTPNAHNEPLYLMTAQSSGRADADDSQDALSAFSRPLPTAVARYRTDDLASELQFAGLDAGPSVLLLRQILVNGHRATGRIPPQEIWRGDEVVPPTLIENALLLGTPLLIPTLDVLEASPRFLVATSFRRVTFKTGVRLVGPAFASLQLKHSEPRANLVTGGGHTLSFRFNLLITNAVGKLVVLIEDGEFQALSAPPILP